MKTRELLRELLHRSELKPAGLALRLKDEGVSQPQLSRFLGEKTREPKRSTMAPVATFFGISVEALFDEELAEQLLAQIASGEFVVQPRTGRSRASVRPPAKQHTTGSPAGGEAPDPDSIDKTIERMGELLNQASDQDRAAAAQLLLQYAQNPTEGTRIAQAIKLLLKGKQNDPGL